jgi:small GTP-binding protein
MEKYNVVIIGSEGVGKTSIVRRFTTNTFTSEYKRTLGSELSKKLMVIDGRPIELLIYDIGGQKQYELHKKKYLKIADVVIMVIAVDDLKSFNDLLEWNKDVESNGNSRPLKIVAANKIDLRVDNPICMSINQVDRESSNIGCISCVESSAKTGENISSIFTVSAKACMTRVSTVTKHGVKNGA